MRLPREAHMNLPSQDIGTIKFNIKFIKPETVTTTKYDLLFHNLSVEDDRH